MKTQAEREADQAEQIQQLIERAQTASDKTYTYRRGKFNWDVTGQGVICIGVAIWAFWAIISGFVVIIATIALVAALYGVWNTFVSRAYVHSVTITSESLTFECYGKKRSYRLADIHNMRIREFPSTYKLYVRMDDESLLGGRYWVRGWWMEDGDELYYRLLGLEIKLNPNTLKATARRNSDLYFSQRIDEPKAKTDRHAHEGKNAPQKETHGDS